MAPTEILFVKYGNGPAESKIAIGYVIKLWWFNTLQHESVRIILHVNYFDGLIFAPRNAMNPSLYIVIEKIKKNVQGQVDS